MTEFYVLLPTGNLPSTTELQKRLAELEPGFTLDESFDPQKGGTWECKYSDGEFEEEYCCDFSMESSKDLFAEAPELEEYAPNCTTVAVFISEDENELASAYALAEVIMDKVPGGFLFDPFEGALMHAEDAIFFFHDQLSHDEDDEDYDAE